MSAAQHAAGDRGRVPVRCRTRSSPTASSRSRVSGAVAPGGFVSVRVIVRANATPRIVDQQIALLVKERVVATEVASAPP